MHGHIEYVRRQLSRVFGKPLDEDRTVALRSMRTMLINGLQHAEHSAECQHRLLLVGEIDQYLQGGSTHELGEPELRRFPIEQALGQAARAE